MSDETPTDDKPKELPTKSPDAAKQAREQAKEYGSMFAPTTLTLDDGGTIDVPPHPNLELLDDDAMATLNELHLEIESCDRYPDVFIPEQTIKDSSGNELKLPSEMRPGTLKLPYRKTVGETTTLMTPPYKVRVAQIALGDQDYGRLRAGNVNGRRGSAADVWRIWDRQAFDVGEREKSDSKSDGSAVDSAPVPAADTAGS